NAGTGGQGGRQRRRFRGAALEHRSRHGSGGSRRAASTCAARTHAREPRRLHDAAARQSGDEVSARTWLDATRRALRCGAAALALVAGIAPPVHGHGPLEIVNQQAVVYPNGATSLTLNLDQGPLGTHTN